jgi:hypothetical protein
MPIDVWNVHAFILREEAGSWGVGIPPGMAGETGQLSEIGDHADIGIFRDQIPASADGWQSKTFVRGP